MQGHRGTIGSFPEILDFDHGSSNAAVSQQICWNSLSNPAEDGLPDFILPSSDASITHLNSTSHEAPNMAGWSFGEPSSSNSQTEIFSDEPKNEHGWSSSLLASAVAGPRLPEEQYEPTNLLSAADDRLSFSSNNIANGSSLQSPSSDAMTQDIDINARLPVHGDDDCQLIEHPTYKFSKSLTERIPSSSSSSDPFGIHSRNSRHLVVEENVARPDCSMQGRRLPCKRKAFEGAGGQSSVDGSSSFQHAETSAWHAVSAGDTGGRNLNISSPSDNALGVGPSDPAIMRPGRVSSVSVDSLPPISMVGGAETSRRNSRVRINPSHPQTSVPPNLFSRGSGIGNLSMSSPSPLPRILPVNHLQELGSVQTGDIASSQNESFVVRVPPLPQSGRSFRWNGASSSRSGISPNPIVSGVRDTTLREDPNLRNFPRNTGEPPMFVPTTELRSLARNPTNWTVTGSLNISGNVASPSRTGSSSGNSASASSRVSHRNSSSLYPRRLSELVRRSLLHSSIGSESVGQSSSHPTLHSGPAGSSQEMMVSSSTGNQVPHQPNARSGLWLDRHGEGALGFSYPLRNYSAGSEGRSRLVSEIRNVLDLVRRSEGLRFEDQFLILDHAPFFSAADAHDRHRDMRLDVDNMSYEELLALEERIGNVSTGLSEEKILTSMKQHKYTVTPGAAIDMEPCCVCQEEYCEGDALGTLDCGHEFHTECIKQWLGHKNLCPICKTTALQNH